ncbi:MAG: hypothetical protein WD063_09985 [Pirellulales bacterium]
MTLDTYSHVLPSMEKDAAGGLDLMLVATPAGKHGGNMAVKSG